MTGLGGGLRGLGSEVVSLVVARVRCVTTALAGTTVVSTVTLVISPAVTMLRISTKNKYTQRVKTNPTCVNSCAV